MSVNIEGLRNNKLYLEEVINSADIICIQEHWLFNCELSTVPEITGMNHYTARSVDEYNPLSPWRLPRGYGGVGILWKDHLHPSVSLCRTAGNERVQAVLCSLPMGKTLLINCYMPSGNSVKIKDQYLDTLQLLDSLLNIHKHNHFLILVGDFNIDLFNRKKKYDGRRRAFTGLLKKYDLLIHADGTSPTMFSHDGKSHSCIDYIATDIPHLHGSVANTLEMVPWNSSCHTPVSMKLSWEDLTPEAAESAQPHGKPMRHVKHRKVKWHTLNVETYQSIISTLLLNVNPQLLPIEDLINMIQEVMSAAANQAAETIDPKKAHRKRKQTYPTPVLDALKKARLVHYEWKQAGRPAQPHPLAALRKKSKKSVRAAQRRHNAEGRGRKLKAIMAATVDDQKTFHALLKAHTKSSNTNINPVRVAENIVTDPAGIMSGWADCFEALGTPQITASSDSALMDVTMNMELVKDLWTHQKLISPVNLEVPTVSADEIKSALKALKPGKAVDEAGLAAEHLTRAGPSLIYPLQWLVSMILTSGCAPKALTLGRKIPFPKKGKDPLLMSNHRGITITPVLGKVLEHVMKERLESYLPTHTLQYGFTRGCAPNMAAVCVTEAMSAASARNPLIIVTLDVEKAFDTVNHDILLQKVYSANAPLNICATISALYDAPEEYVVLNGLVSRKYSVGQGVRQGGVLSTPLYKLYIDDLLHQLQREGDGLFMGAGFAGCPTCADDILLMATNEDRMQYMLDTVFEYSKHHKYKINHGKTTLTILGRQMTSELFLGQDRLTPAEKFVHLGILREVTCGSQVIQDRIDLARRTLYALLPAGLHGHDGLSPVASRKVIEAYVLPRMLYGLEAMILTQKQINSLEIAYRTMLRQLQALPSQVATEAIYLLMGMFPIEAVLHHRTLSLFGAIVRLDNNSFLKTLACRQLGSQVAKRKSWFQHVLAIAKNYGLDQFLHYATQVYIPKQDWNKAVLEPILDFWSHELRRRAMDKSTLHFMDITSHSPRHPSAVWPTNANAQGILAASYRAKMLTGSYILQKTRAKYNQHGVNPLCQLCRLEEEDVTHFLTSCPALARERDRVLVREILPLIEKLGLDFPVQSRQQCRFVLNGGFARISRGPIGGGPIVESLTGDKLHKACSTLCLKLHQKRLDLLADQRLLEAP